MGFVADIVRRGVRYPLARAYINLVAHGSRRVRRFPIVIASDPAYE